MSHVHALKLESHFDSKPAAKSEYQKTVHLKVIWVILPITVKGSCGGVLELCTPDLWLGFCLIFGFVSVFLLKDNLSFLYFSSWFKKLLFLTKDEVSISMYASYQCSANASYIISATCNEKHADKLRSKAVNNFGEPNG